MLQVNEILKYQDMLYRVLRITTDQIVWIDIKSPSALPNAVFLDEVTNAIDNGLLSRVDDPFSYLAFTTIEPSSTAQIKRDRNFGYIRDLVNSPECFEPKARSNRINEICRSTGAIKKTIYKLLRRYWQRGQIPNALLPDYKKSGAKGQKRTAHSSKLGRPRKYSPGVGATIDEDIERLFRISIERHILTTKEKSFPYAYRRFLDIYQTYYPDTPKSEVPSLGQMRYFYTREYGKNNTLRKRINAIRYNKDIAPLTSTVNANALGPASRIEIDATIADIYLVSDNDHRKIIGRPTVYIVKDTFSRLIAGYYIGFQSPSYVTATFALAMAMLDKIEHCKLYGFEITSEEWPAIGIPGAILADRGELLGHQIETLESGFSVRIENAPSFRADAKGIVERSFRTIQAEFKPFAPGVVEDPISKKRGGKDYRLDAALTITEFRQIILSSILYHNRYAILQDYDRCSDMPDDLIMTPLNIWNWGIQNRTGGIRAVSEEQLKIGLLPRTKATVSNLGICVFGVYYTSAELIKSGWLQRSKEIIRPKGLSAAYDLASADRIFLFPTDDVSEYWACHLSPRSRQFSGMSFWDVWRTQSAQKKTSATSCMHAEEKRREHEHFVAKIIGKATKRQPKQFQESNAKRIRSIRSNKQEARSDERNEPFLAPPKPNPGNKPATVIPFRESSKDDYSYPDYTDELFIDEDT